MQTYYCKEAYSGQHVVSLSLAGKTQISICESLCKLDDLGRWCAGLWWNVAILWCCE